MHQLWQKEELSHYFWVKFQSNLRCFMKNLHDWQEFYTTAGRSGRAKYQLCIFQNQHLRVLLHLDMHIGPNAAQVVENGCTMGASELSPPQFNVMGRPGCWAGKKFATGTFSRKKYWPEDGNFSMGWPSIGKLLTRSIWASSRLLSEHYKSWGWLARRKAYVLIVV